MFPSRWRKSQRRRTSRCDDTSRALGEGGGGAARESAAKRQRIWKHMETMVVLHSFLVEKLKSERLFLG